MRNQPTDTKMTTKFSLTIIFFLSLSISFGQINGRGHASLDYYVDGFRVYKNLTKSDSLKILADVVTKLNGCWESQKQIHKFKLSDQTFQGTWDIKGIHSTAPLVRLEFVNGQVKLIVTDVIGGDGSPKNVKVDEKKLTIQYDDSKNTFRCKRLKTCP